MAAQGSRPAPTLPESRDAAHGGRMRQRAVASEELAAVAA